MKKNKIILYGAGRALYNQLCIINFSENIDEFEIWDTNVREYMFNEKKITVYAPRKNVDCDMIIITSKIYYDEIFKMLTEQYSYPSSIIKDTSHLDFVIINLLNKKYCNDESKKSILEFINTNKLGVFNYDFTKKYNYETVKVVFDETHQLYYYLWNNKKMYLSKEFDTQKKAQIYINSILLEQDVESPHYYDPDICANSNNHLLIDAGVAEGFFALDYIDKVDRIILIECDINWVQALKLTFKDYMHKVTIYQKMVSDILSEDTITIDSIVGNDELSILKLDVEGSEAKALLGAKKAINNSTNFSAYACAYHNPTDEDFIYNYFPNNKFKTCATGYMYYPPSYSIKLTRGVIKVNKLI